MWVLSLSPSPLRRGGKPEQAAVAGGGRMEAVGGGSWSGRGEVGWRLKARLVACGHVGCLRGLGAGWTDGRLRRVGDNTST